MVLLQFLSRQLLSQRLLCCFSGHQTEEGKAPISNGHSKFQPGFNAFAATPYSDNINDAAPFDFVPPEDYQPPADLPSIVSGNELSLNEGPVRKYVTENLHSAEDHKRIISTQGRLILPYAY